MSINFGTIFMKTNSKEYDIITNFSSNGSINSDSVIFGNKIRVDIIIINKSDKLITFTPILSHIREIKLCSEPIDKTFDVLPLSKAKIRFSISLNRQIDYDDSLKLSIFNNLKIKIELCESILYFPCSKLYELMILRYYSKGDSRWKTHLCSIMNNTDQTINDSECALTSMAIIISSIKNISVLPVEVCKLAIKEKFKKICNNTSLSIFANIANEYGLNCEKTSELSYLIKQLSAQKKMSVCRIEENKFSYSDYMIVIYGVETINDKVYFLLMDPNQNSQGYWLNKFDEVIFESGDSNDGLVKVLTSSLYREIKTKLFYIISPPEFDSKPSINITNKNSKHRYLLNNTFEINYGIAHIIVQEIDIKESSLFNPKFEIELQSNEFLLYKNTGIIFCDEDGETIPTRIDVEFNDVASKYIISITVTDQKLIEGKYHIRLENKLTLNSDNYSIKELVNLNENYGLAINNFWEFGYALTNLIINSKKITSNFSVLTKLIYSDLTSSEHNLVFVSERILLDIKNVNKLPLGF